MLIIDTSVWIDFFQNPQSTYQETLEGLIRDNNRAVICGIILQEILQGIKDNQSYEITKQRLIKLPFIDTDKEIYLYASSLYKKLRSKGITVPPVDVTIAAIAIRNKIPILTDDEHFKTIAKHSELKLY
ncbi:MAG: PIN domain nuclease [Thermodesulfovibrionales bacterium]